jgi:hypothetical protein
MDRTCRLGMLSILAWSLTLVRGDVVIDMFDTGPFTLDYDSREITVNADPGQIAGGTRHIVIDNEPNLLLPHSSASLVAGNGFLEYQRQQNGNFSLTYGSFASVPMNLDLKAGGHDHFRLQISAAPGPGSLLVKLQDNSFFSRTANSGFNFPGPGTYELPFAAFGDLEFDKLGGIKLEMVPSSGPPFNGPGLYRFDSLVAVVPEPSSIAVGGLLWLAFWFSSRVRRTENQ